MKYSEIVPLLTEKYPTANKLPGTDAQLTMAHHFRRTWVGEVPENARIAAVLMLLFPIEDIAHFALIERSSKNQNDRHGGQMSFPGGQLEANDTSLQHTALRETWEEIGVPTQQINIIGKLTELYIPVSNFQVHPFVGAISQKPTFQLQETEVKQILEVPLQWIFDDNKIKNTNLHISDTIVLKDVPYFDIHNKIVWGATAMMLHEFKTIINNLENR